MYIIPLKQILQKGALIFITLHFIQFQGHIGEGALESMHKWLRYLLKWRSRPFLIEGLTDAYNHLWIRTSPWINSFSGQPPKKLGPIPMKTEDDREVAKYIIT